jgi:hypothetical protein
MCLHLIRVAQQLPLRVHPPQSWCARKFVEMRLRLNFVNIKTSAARQIAQCILLITTPLVITQIAILRLCGSNFQQLHLNYLWASAATA